MKRTHVLGKSRMFEGEPVGSAGYTADDLEGTNAYLLSTLAPGRTIAMLPDEAHYARELTRVKYNATITGFRNYLILYCPGRLSAQLVVYQTADINNPQWTFLQVIRPDMDYLALWSRGRCVSGAVEFYSGTLPSGAFQLNGQMFAVAYSAPFNFYTMGPNDLTMMRESDSASVSNITIADGVVVLPGPPADTEMRLLDTGSIEQSGEGLDVTLMYPAYTGFENVGGMLSPFVQTATNVYQIADLTLTSNPALPPMLYGYITLDVRAVLNLVAPATVGARGYLNVYYTNASGTYFMPVSLTTSYQGNFATAMVGSNVCAFETLTPVSRIRFEVATPLATGLGTNLLVNFTPELRFSIKSSEYLIPGHSSNGCMLIASNVDPLTNMIVSGVSNMEFTANAATTLVSKSQDIPIPLPMDLSMAYRVFLRTQATGVSKCWRRTDYERFVNDIAPHLSERSTLQAYTADWKKIGRGIRNFFSKALPYARAASKFVPGPYSGLVDPVISGVQWAVDHTGSTADGEEVAYTSYKQPVPKPTDPFGSVRVPIDITVGFPVEPPVAAKEDVMRLADTGEFSSEMALSFAQNPRMVSSWLLWYAKSRTALATEEVGRTSEGKWNLVIKDVLPKEPPERLKGPLSRYAAGGVMCTDLVAVKNRRPDIFRAWVAWSKNEGSKNSVPLEATQGEEGTAYTADDDEELKFELSEELTGTLSGRLADEIRLDEWDAPVTINASPGVVAYADDTQSGKNAMNFLHYTTIHHILLKKALDMKVKNDYPDAVPVLVPYQSSAGAGLFLVVVSNRPYKKAFKGNYDSTDTTNSRLVSYSPYHHDYAGGDGTYTINIDQSFGEEEQEKLQILMSYVNSDNTYFQGDIYVTLVRGKPKVIKGGSHQFPILACYMGLPMVGILSGVVKYFEEMDLFLISKAGEGAAKLEATHPTGRPLIGNLDLQEFEPASKATSDTPYIPIKTVVEYTLLVQARGVGLMQKVRAEGIVTAGQRKQAMEDFVEFVNRNGWVKTQGGARPWADADWNDGNAPEVAYVRALGSTAKLNKVDTVKQALNVKYIKYRNAASAAERQQPAKAKRMNGDVALDSRDFMPIFPRKFVVSAFNSVRLRNPSLVIAPDLLEYFSKSTDWNPTYGQIMAMNGIVLSFMKAATSGSGGEALKRLKLLMEKLSPSGLQTTGPDKAAVPINKNVPAEVQEFMRSYFKQVADFKSGYALTGHRSSGDFGKVKGPPVQAKGVDVTDLSSLIKTKSPVARPAEQDYDYSSLLGDAESFKEQPPPAEEYPPLEKKSQPGSSRDGPGKGGPQQQQRGGKKKPAK